MTVNVNLPSPAVGAAVIIKKFLAPLIPYITVGTGLLIIHNAWAAMLGYHLGMLLVLWITKPGIPVKQLFRSGNYKIPLVTGLLGASGGILMYLLWPLLEVPADISLNIRSIGLNEITWPVFLAYFILVNPWIEEYYWRGFLGSDQKRVVLNDLFFAGYHILVLAGKMGAVWLLVIFLVLSVGAWFWRQANRWSRGLLPSVASHIAADITVIFAIYFMTF